MTKVSEDMLMALADGELDRETAAQIQRAVDADPALARRLAAFRRARLLAKASFADVLEEAVPPHLVAAAGGAPARDRRAPGWRERLGTWQGAWLPVGSLAAAALAGIVVAPLVLDRAPASLLAREGEIARLLETSASGQAVETDGGAFEATATWLTEGGVCRGFVASEAGAEMGWRGVGCRHEGAWTVDLLVADRAAAADGVFAPASDRAVQSIDAFLDAVGAGAALDDAEEQRLRERAWRAEGEAGPVE